MFGGSKPGQASLAINSLWTARDVAKRLNVSIGWVHDHANGKRRPFLRSIKVGKCLRFRPADVEAFIEECQRILGAA